MIASASRPALVVVGSGMAGGKVIEEILARAPGRFDIRLFGAEPHGTYNRILLSGVLGGFVEPGQLWLNSLEWYEERGVGVHPGIKVESIDRDRQVVSGAGGKVVEPYDYLVLATGSRPFVPPLEGTKQNGVFVFRTLADCAAIATYAQDCRRATVLGGGLLGLEAARGLLSHRLEVTVVEVASHLMPQQLDLTAGLLLQRKLEALGIQLRLNAAAAELIGEDGRVRGVRLQDGTVLDTDLVVVSCGIRPNVDEARTAGLDVRRGIVVDDQLRSSDPDIFAVGECAEHRGRLYGLVDPVYEQARVLAAVLSETDRRAAYSGSRLATTLKVMGIDLTAMGEVEPGPGDEVFSHLDPNRGVYRKLVSRDGKLVGAVLLGTPDHGGRLQRLFREGEPLPAAAFEWPERADTLPVSNNGSDLDALADDAQICNCHRVCKGTLVNAIKSGKSSVAALGTCTKAGTGCGSCQPLLAQLLQSHGKTPAGAAKVINKIELLKQEKDGLDAMPDILKLAPTNNWAELTEADKQRAKWHGLFYRQTTPGHFMMRLRFQAGQTNARQLRVLADLSDEFGKGFADLTTRQQIQLRWFTLADVGEIWRRLEEVGLHSKQTGMDNVRGICGCPVAGLTPHELLDATPVIHALDRLILDNKEFSNLPRKFNITITGCLENCCHTETQDVALVPAYRELDGQQVNGFNLLVGGKQGSGGYRPASPLDVFLPPAEAALVCAEVARIFRDHGSRQQRNRARLAFLLDERGAAWMRAELEKRLGRSLWKAGTDVRKPHYADHLGIHPQKRPGPDGGPQRFSVGLLVPVGRITSAQMRGVADLADRYGTGDIRVTVGQNVVVVNVPEDRLGALSEEPLLQELPHDPSPIMRGLVSCTGNDYCAMALIDTKGYAVEVARELERRTAGRKLQPLTMHWSGCPAGCGLHQVATIGLQGCRSRVNGQVVDAAHVCINGRAGPQPVVATDVMYDVPAARLAEALEPLVSFLPRN